MVDLDTDVRPAGPSCTGAPLAVRPDLRDNVGPDSSANLDAFPRRQLTLLAKVVVWAGRGLWAALLPPPERDRLSPGQLFAARWSVAVGLVEGSLGLFAYMFGALAFMGPTGGDQAVALLESGIEIDTFDIRGGGLLTWFAWHLRPEAWLYVYFALTGLVRTVAYLAASVPVAEPVVLVALRLVQAILGAAERFRVRVQFGPVRQDRALLEPGCDLALLASRPKEGWDDHSTVKVGDRFYRILDVSERAEQRGKVVAYRLAELETHDAVRGLVHSSARLPADIPDQTTRPAPDQLFYFAYGELISDDEMWEVAPSARLIGVAKCPRHRLWLQRPRDDGVGIAAAVPSTSPSDAVWGVVWDCDADDAAALDAAERIGEHGHWEDIRVNGADGNRYLARVCVSDVADLDLGLSSSPELLETMLERGRALGFPAAYLAPITEARR